VAESRDLRYFVAVAERLNFSRAAEHLHIARRIDNDSPLVSAFIEVVEELKGKDAGSLPVA
jgi:hypothetical protein